MGFYSDYMFECNEDSRRIKIRRLGLRCIISWGIDIIEGNHAPDVDVMQSPLRKGIKRFIALKLKEYFDYQL